MKTREMTGKLHELQKRVGDTATTVGRRTDEYVHEYTWASVGIAALLGCVLGFLIGSRRD